jgi:hypothetical protein
MTPTGLSLSGRWPHSLCLSRFLHIFLTNGSHVSRARLLVLAGLFVISPRLLIFMAGESRTILTPLEAFLAFQFGILLFAVSVGVLINVCAPSDICWVYAYRYTGPFWRFVHSSRRSASTPTLSSATYPYDWRNPPDVILSVQRNKNRNVVYCVFRNDWNGWVVGVMDSETIRSVTRANL